MSNSCNNQTNNENESTNNVNNSSANDNNSSIDAVTFTGETVESGKVFMIIKTKSIPLTKQSIKRTDENDCFLSLEPDDFAAFESVAKLVDEHYQPIPRSNEPKVLYSLTPDLLIHH